jgi:alpha-ketoglutarate-dependent taurine dioxygenase
VGDLPPTPDRPTTPATKDQISEFVLLTVARQLGQPVGYLPEHGGDLVQNILPVRGAEARQVSTSSRVELMFHTEAAFHPHRPRYLLLLCLRGDSQARTTLASIREIVRMLPLGVRRTLFEPRFRTAADESYVGARPTHLGLAMPVLSGTWHEPSLVFDADLMVGIDEEADQALGALTAAVEACHTGVVLEPGDLLVVDNAVAVHGRSPFTPRFDGTDRWLQRTFVVSDLAPSAADRDARIIATHFAA